MTEIFSQEILDKIIDHLSEALYDDSWSGRHARSSTARRQRYGLSDLHSASLVCRGFRARCQFHIFRVIDLSILVDGIRSLIKNERPHRRERMHSLPRLLQEQKYLTGGPMTCSLFFDHSGTLTYDEGLSYNLNADADLEYFLQCLRDNTGIQITELHIGSTSMFRRSDHPLLSILPLINLNNINKLVLDTVAVVPLSLFASCPHLSDLVLNSVIVEQRRASAGIPGAAPPRQQVTPILQRLYHTYVGTGLDLIQGETKDFPVVDMTQLRTLGVRVNLRNSNQPDFLTGMIPVYSDLAALCGDRLRELHIRAGELPLFERSRIFAYGIGSKFR